MGRAERGCDASFRHWLLGACRTARPYSLRTILFRPCKRPGRSDCDLDLGLALALAGRAGGGDGPTDAGHHRHCNQVANSWVDCRRGQRRHYVAFSMILAWALVFARCWTTAGGAEIRPRGTTTLIAWCSLNTFVPLVYLASVATALLSDRGVVSGTAITLAPGSIAILMVQFATWIWILPRQAQREGTADGGASSTDLTLTMRLAVLAAARWQVLVWAALTPPMSRPRACAGRAPCGSRTPPPLYPVPVFALVIVAMFMAAWTHENGGAIIPQ